MSLFKFAVPGAAILCTITLINGALAGEEAEARISMSAYRARSTNGIQRAGHEVQQAGGGPVVQANGGYVAPGGGAPQLNPHGINVGQYPQLNAPLYPSPVQHVPEWTGGTVITNQAFAPHELLYPHEYHSMYGPFHYKVKGCWIWTPFGMRQHEEWKLQGTEVRVKYRSHYKLFSGFHPPINY